VPLAEKIIDHEILCFTFETEERAAAFVEAASEAIGVAPGIFKGMTAQRDGEKFDLPVPDKVKPPSNRGNKGLPPPPGDRRAARCRGGRCRHLEWKHPEHGAAVTPRLLSSPYVSSDSALRHAGAMQCMQIATMLTRRPSLGAKQNSVVSTRSVKAVYRELAPFQHALKLCEQTGFNLLVDLRSEQHSTSRIAPRDLLDDL
jgi:hypothetical protein